MICENLTSSANIVNQPHALGDIKMNIQGLLHGITTFYCNIEASYTFNEYSYNYNSKKYIISCVFKTFIVHLTLQWPFVIQVCWIAEHGVSFKGKKQFESVRGDGYQQWKAESWLHEGLRLKVNECLYIAALQFEPHAHKRNEREKLMPLWIGIIFLRHPRDILKSDV